MNINDVPPQDITTTPPAPTDPTQSLSGNINQLDPNEIQTQDEHFGTPGQQVITGLEGAAQGVIGPLAPAIERGFGVNPQDINARAEANPLTHAGSEAAGFGASLFVPVLGEASLAGQVGNIGEHAAALLPEATGTIAKIASTGIKTGAEMAALQTSDEISKVVTQDPNQTLQTAAINIGLSGILGGVGGSVLGSVGPLWDKAVNKIGAEKLATDFMGETQHIMDTGTDPVAATTAELQGRIQAADDMWKTMSETKPEVLAQAMPEATPENAAKIDASIQDISDQMQEKLNKAAGSVKTKNALPYLNEDLMNFQEAVTNPNASFADKFVATNKLKTTLEGYAKWGEGFGATEESSAKGQLGRSLSNIIRPTLEDTKIWGAAGDVQRVTNDAISESIRATKDMRSAVTSKLMGESQVDPSKVQTLLNQTNAGKASLKANKIAQYLESTQKYADAINTVHMENGLEAPLSSKLNPTPVLDHALNTPLTPGVSLARWANKNGADMVAKSIGEATSGGVGGGLGFLIGHPLVGAAVGEKVLSPIFSALAKPLAETAVNPTAMKATVEYLGNFIKGAKQLSTATANLMKPGVEVLAKDAIPTQESRDKLQKSLDLAQNPQNIQKVGGQIGHYLPQHATAAAYTVSVASQYLNNLKPKQPTLNAFDKAAPIDKAQQTKYNRALDIAQQPLMVLEHVKNGTLLPQDVQTLNTIYPNLHSQMISQISNELIKNKADNIQIPYAQRVALSQLMGAPLDSTMSPPIVQAIMKSSMTQQAQQQNQPGKAPKKASGVELKQINQVNTLYPTQLESRQMNKRQ